MTDLKQTIYIDHNNRKVPVLITECTDPEIKDEGAIHVFCEKANLDEDHLLTDLPGLLQALPGIIDWQQSLKKEAVIRLRLSPQEKAKISTLAFEKGFSSISAYMRSVALNS